VYQHSEARRRRKTDCQQHIKMHLLSTTLYHFKTPFTLEESEDKNRVGKEYRRSTLIKREKGISVILLVRFHNRKLIMSVQNFLKSQKKKITLVIIS
jgi:hypothetical protein